MRHHAGKLFRLLMHRREQRAGNAHVADGQNNGCNDDLLQLNPREPQEPNRVFSREQVDCCRKFEPFQIRRYKSLPQKPSLRSRFRPTRAVWRASHIELQNYRRDMMQRYIASLILVGALAAPVITKAAAPQEERHEDHDRDRDKDRDRDRDRDHDRDRVYDRYHNDYHNWDARENENYRGWYNQNYKQNHREYREYSGLSPEEQREYWNWRHNHKDRDHDRDRDRHHDRDDRH